MLQRDCKNRERGAIVKKSLGALLAMVAFTMMLSQVAFATDFTMDKEVPMEEWVSKQEYYNALKKEYEKYDIGFEMEQYDPTIDSDFVCTRDELEEAVEDARAFAEGIKIIG